MIFLYLLAFTNFHTEISNKQHGIIKIRKIDFMFVFQLLLIFSFLKILSSMLVILSVDFNGNWLFLIGRTEKKTKFKNGHASV